LLGIACWLGDCHWTIRLDRGGDRQFDSGLHHVVIARATGPARACRSGEGLPVQQRGAVGPTDRDFSPAASELAPVG